MGPQQGPQDIVRGRTTLRTSQRTARRTTDPSRTRDSRIHKMTARVRGRGNRGRSRRRSKLSEGHVQREDASADEARDVQQRGLPPKVSRIDSGLHACSELSLHFATRSGLKTSADTNTITLNLMDHFLFSEDNWLPELSYCKLHAVCFYLASLVTGQQNTVEQIAAILGADSSFVREMAAPLAEDEEAAIYIQQVISVSNSDVEDGYKLLYDRTEDFRALMGEYTAGLEGLPVPRVAPAEEYAHTEVRKENFDVFDEDVVFQ